MEKKQKKERTIKDFVDILLPKLWLILLIAVVFAMAAFTFFATRKNTYTSSAEYLVTWKPTGTSSQYYESDIVKNTIGKYEKIVKGDEFCNIAVQRVNDENKLGLKINDISEFKSMFNFNSGSNQTFTFSITHTNKDAAFEIIKIVEVCLREEMESGENTSYEDIRRLSAPKEARLNSKNSFRNALIAFAVGAVITGSVIVVIAIFDVTIRDKKKIEDHFNIPVIGIIPYHDVNTDSTGGVYGYGYGGHRKK